MNKKIKLLSFSTLITFSMLTPSAVYGAEQEIEPKLVQLVKAKDSDMLRGILASGDDIILKINVNLKDGRSTYTTQGNTHFPVRLFLTDSENGSLDHPEITYNEPIQCSSTPPKYVLPTPQPDFFKSFDDYSSWLQKTQFTTKVVITCDFIVDLKVAAPDLLKQLPPQSPSCFRAKGSYEIDKSQIIPDSCRPTVSYHSNIDKHVTVATLGGTLMLCDMVYFIDVTQQEYNHPSETKEIDFNNSRKIICQDWLITDTNLIRREYNEFPTDLIKSWPEAPEGTYSVTTYEPERVIPIKSFKCFFNNEEVPTFDCRIFICDNEQEIENEKNSFLNLKVKDENGRRYHVSYKHAKELKENMPKRLENYRLACDMFLPGKLIYKDGKIIQVSDHLNTKLNTGIAG